MKTFWGKWLAFALLGLAFTACGGNKGTAGENDVKAEGTQGATPTLSAENKKLAEKCQKNSQEDCRQLITNLAGECQRNNAQSCVDIAVLFIKVHEEAVKAKNNEQALQSYNVAVGSLLKACELKNQAACDSLKQLSNQIFGNLLKVKKACTEKNDAQSCTVYQEANKVLKDSCSAGREQDCQYLKALQ